MLSNIIVQCLSFLVCCSYNTLYGSYSVTENGTEMTDASRLGGGPHTPPCSPVGLSPHNNDDIITAPHDREYDSDDTNSVTSVTADLTNEIEDLADRLGGGPSTPLVNPVGLSPLHSTATITTQTQNIVTTSDVETQSINMTFSPLTCYELLGSLTEKQVQRELAYFNGCDKAFKIQATRDKAQTKTRTIQALSETLIDELGSDYNNLLDVANISNSLYNGINPSFSYNIERLHAQSNEIETQLNSLAGLVEDLRSTSHTRSRRSRPIISEVLLETVSTPVNSDTSVFPPPFQTRTSTRLSTAPSQPAPQNNRKILFLTDSILMPFDPSKYRKRGETVVVVKLPLMKLHELDIGLFNGFDTIVISSGMNDHKYGYGPADLFNFLKEKLSHVDKNVRVIFKGLTPTKHEYLNEFVYAFNNMVFNLSLGTSNLYYYDPYPFEGHPEFIKRGGNGVHLSPFIAIQMARDILDHDFTDRKRLPLRPSLAQRFSLGTRF